jgi:hypothetical protein
MGKFEELEEKAVLRKNNLSFGMIPKELLNDANVSLSAKALFAVINAKSTNGEINTDDIELISKESIFEIKAILKELAENGYIK